MLPYSGIYLGLGKEIFVSSVNIIKFIFLWNSAGTVVTKLQGISYLTMNLPLYCLMLIVMVTTCLLFPRDHVHFSSWIVCRLKKTLFPGRIVLEYNCFFRNIYDSSSIHLNELICFNHNIFASKIVSLLQTVIQTTVWVQVFKSEYSCFDNGCITPAAVVHNGPVFFYKSLYPTKNSTKHVSDLLFI